MTHNSSSHHELVSDSLTEAQDDYEVRGVAMCKEVGTEEEEGT